MNDKFVTIKVLESSKRNLNLISAMSGEKQYEVLERISENEVIRIKLRNVKTKQS